MQELQQRPTTDDAARYYTQEEIEAWFRTPSFSRTKHYCLQFFNNQVEDLEDALQEFYLFTLRKKIERKYYLPSRAIWFVRGFNFEEQRKRKKLLFVDGFKEFDIGAHTTAPDFVLERVESERLIEHKLDEIAKFPGEQGRVLRLVAGSSISNMADIWRKSKKEKIVATGYNGFKAHYRHALIKLKEKTAYEQNLLAKEGLAPIVLIKEEEGSEDLNEGN